MSEARSYPRHAKTDAGEIEFRMMARSDEAALSPERNTLVGMASRCPTSALLPSLHCS